jgi:caffeoyl-CoA O-methyltransferase
MTADPSTRVLPLSPELQRYVLDHLNPPVDAVVTGLARATAERFGDLAGMNIGADQGALLRFLVQISGARSVAEVGTFTGMSALWLARGLPAGGRLTCFELRPEPIELARVAWSAAGVADRIEVIIGPALDGIAAMPDDWRIDLGFVDADKGGYLGYVDALLPRLTPTGFLLLDNTLWSGRVIDPHDTEPDTEAIRQLNAALAARGDVDVVPLTVGDGLTVVRPRTPIED